MLATPASSGWATWLLAPHTHLMLESLQHKLVVAGTDSNPQQVAQIPKHGHEWELPIVCKRSGIEWEKQINDGWREVRNQSKSFRGHVESSGRRERGPHMWPILLKMFKGLEKNKNRKNRVGLKSGEKCIQHCLWGGCFNKQLMSSLCLLAPALRLGSIWQCVFSKLE